MSSIAIDDRFITASLFVETQESLRRVLRACGAAGREGHNSSVVGGFVFLEKLPPTEIELLFVADEKERLRT